jgi:hypothetical protein
MDCELSASNIVTPPIYSSTLQVIKYTLVYLIVISFFASLIVLREWSTTLVALWQLTHPLLQIAALMRNHIDFSCTLCQNL